MLAILIVVGVIAILFAVPSPEKKTAPVVEHHQTTLIERPVYVQAHVYFIQAQIMLAEANKAPEPVRLPEARLHLNPSMAIERYRSHERHRS